MGKSQPPVGERGITRIHWDCSETEPQNIFLKSLSLGATLCRVFFKIVRWEECIFAVNSIGVCQFNCSASNTFSILAEALNGWESAIERKVSCSHCLLTEHGSMTELQSITCSARRLNPARVTSRWTACQRLSAAAAVQSGIQWWDGGGPKAAVTSLTPLSRAWSCLCCSSFGSCQPFRQLCELPSSFSINSFFPFA